MTTPEQAEIKAGEQAGQVPESGVVKEIAEEVPPEVERVPGVQTVKTQVTAKVSDDSGKPMMTSPATQQITITLPASPKQLEDWAQGSPDNALTWFANFWIRVIKKAIQFGWRIVMGKEEE